MRKSTLLPTKKGKIGAIHIFWSETLKRKRAHNFTGIYMLFLADKLDGVGPVDNRPSTKKLHHFVRKKKRKKIVTCDTWHVTCDTWRDTWHMTCDKFGGGEYALKTSAP